MKIAPSIISADFSRLSEDIEEVERAGVDLMHIDVYPLLAWGFEYRTLGSVTIGPLMVEALRDRTNLPLDVHLAIDVSNDTIMKYVRAGSNIITFHVEACLDPQRMLHLIKDQGLRGGVALNPSTPISLVEAYARDLDVILLMTTSANFGGPNIGSHIIPKIKNAAILREQQCSFFDIEVDGGIDAASAPELVAAGANVLVVGNAIFKQGDYIAAVKKLREACAHST